MKKILIIDFETIGVDPNTCQIIEVACILCNEKCEILESFSFLVDPKENVPLKTTEITGIYDDLINFKSSQKNIAISRIKNAVEEADVLVAHNGYKFDFKILEVLGMEIFDKKILIDTMYHLKFSKFTTSKRLTHLCADKGIFFQDSHRALSDCLALLALLRVDGFEVSFKKSQEKLMQVIAKVSKETKDKASSEGFKWNGVHWWKIIFESEFKELEQIMKEKDVVLQIQIADLKLQDL